MTREDGEAVYFIGRLAPVNVRALEPTRSAVKSLEGDSASHCIRRTAEFVLRIIPPAHDSTLRFGVLKLS